MTRVAALLSSVLTVAVATTATAALAKKHGFGLDDLHALRRTIRGGPTPVTVYLHRDGGRVIAGKDDPEQARSGVLQRSGVSVVDVPAFRGSDKQWDQFVGCVENHFRDFDVTVVEQTSVGEVPAVIPKVRGAAHEVWQTFAHQGSPWGQLVFTTFFVTF